MIRGTEWARHISPLFAALIALVVASSARTEAPEGRFLVLGFDSKQLNEIQDRLLRESVMRRLAEKGYRVVPVMEVESLLHGERKGRVRSLTRSEVRGLCRDLDAGYACYGHIEPDGGGRDNSIEKGRSYRCSLALYGRTPDEFREFSITFTGQKNLYDLYEVLSESIASKIAESR